MKHTVHHHHSLVRKLMKKLIASISTLVLFSFPVNAQTANHVVVSEVFYLGATSANEFVELYNPTGSDIVLTNISLQAGTGSTPGTNTGEWVVDLSGKTIKAYGFLLVGGTSVVPAPDLSIPAGRDLKNSGIRSGVRLYNTATSTVIDGVAWDATASIGLEGVAITAAGVTPSNAKSIERKARSSSTSASMIAEDALLGNGYDSNDNSIDFLVRDIPLPQNSSSSIEQPYAGPDTIAPAVLSLKFPSNIQIEVTFNEAVDSATASTPANYALNKALVVTQAVRNPSAPSKVMLTLSPMINDVYTLTVRNVKDTSGNVMSTPQVIMFSYGVIPISQARSVGAGQSVRVRGIVTVGNEFKSPSVLQDSTGALAVFNNTFSTNARMGDIWEVAGVLKDFNGLLEIDPLTDSLKISSGNPLPAPLVLASNQLGETNESRLVRINNVRFAATGSFGPSTADSSYSAIDASGALIIRIDKDSNIPGGPIPGDSVNIVGVVNHFTGSYRLMPRSIADIGVVDPLPDQTWTDINIARSYSIGTSVRVRGIVTFNQPGSTGKTIFLQDRTGGIALYDARTDTLLIGDSVEVRGVLADFNGLAELKTIDTLALFGRGFPLPAPKILTISQATEAYESQLLTIHEVQFLQSGTFASAATTYTITDGTNQLDVRIPVNSLLAGLTIPVGAVDIVGVLGQYLTKYQLTPRSSADLIALPGPQIVSQPVISNLSDNGFTVGWSTLLDGTSTLYYGATQSLGDSIVGQTASKTHSFSLTGLRPGRVYYFRGVSSSATGTSSSSIASAVTTSSASTGEIQVYFNYSTDGTLGLTPAANANVALLGKLLERISKATKTIDMALYSFDDFSSNSGVVANRVADSLLSAKNRGVTVRMVFDNKSTTTPLGKLVAGGISVIKRSVPGTDNGIMHNKFFVFDGRDTTSATDDWVTTGSWNVTNEGTLDDAQNAVFIQDQSLARIYTLEFEEMFGSSTTTGNSGSAKFGPMKQNNTPHLTYVGGRKVEVYFSPSDQTTSKIIGALSSADQNIFFGVMSFTRTDIAGTLLARKNAGVLVRGMIDQQPSVLSTLQAGGVDALQAGHSVVAGIFHHKYSIVDPFNDASDPLVITGSHNWSSNAENDNDENTLIIHSGDIARQYVQEFSKRYKESGGSGQVLGVEQIGSTVPAHFGLSQNYPNPFNPRTEIRVQIAEASVVSLKVYDVLGREVATFFDESKAPGVYAVSWDASRMSSGVYLYRLQARPTDNSKGTIFVETRKMILTK